MFKIAFRINVNHNIILFIKFSMPMMYISSFSLIISLRVKIEEQFNVVPNNFQRVFQKQLINLASLLDTIVVENPCNLRISLKNSLAICEASSQKNYPQPQKQNHIFTQFWAILGQSQCLKLSKKYIEQKGGCTNQCLFFRLT